MQRYKSLRVVNLNRRSKLSSDPNNTAWGRSATRYGQKILQSHGWTPGKFLGVSDSAYSKLHSAASASHVRIALKEDNLGLGAKHDAAREGGESTGLDSFEDLLGRLNGRGPVDLKRDRSQRSDLRSSAYINQRWGKLHFVSGGLLVGDDLRDLAKGEQNTSIDPPQTPSRRLEDRTLPEANRPQEVRSETLKREKLKKRKTTGDDHNVKVTGKGVDRRLSGAQSPIIPSVEPEGVSYTTRKQAERPEHKMKREVKRDARHSLKVREQSSILPSPELIQPSGSDTGVVAVASRPLGETIPLARDSQGFGTGRLAVRHRYIQHKKMCMMDRKALNEVRVI